MSGFAKGWELSPPYSGHSPSSERRAYDPVVRVSRSNVRDRIDGTPPSRGCWCKIAISLIDPDRLILNECYRLFASSVKVTDFMSRATEVTGI